MNVMECTATNISMEYYDSRLKTFDTYPKQMLPDKFHLARAGLYFTGKSVVCQCFRCHVKLSAWEREDDAIKELHKWAPSYDYIKMVGAPPQQQQGFTFGSSVSLGGSGRGRDYLSNSWIQNAFKTGEITLTGTNYVNSER